MQFDEYTMAALRTWNPSEYMPEMLNVSYLALGLTNEAGEVAGKIKKIIRDNNSIISDATRLAIGDELGDVLWYLFMLSNEIGLDVNAVAQRNLDKLASRKQRGVIKGSGDNR